jgi:hypothetical protein
LTEAEKKANPSPYKPILTIGEGLGKEDGVNTLTLPRSTKDKFGDKVGTSYGY